MTALDRPALSAQLAPIRARADAATPGEWTLMPERPDGRVAIERPTYDLFTGEVSKFLLVYDTNPADAEFIAAARTDVPALLAIIDRLTAALDVAEKTPHDWGCVGWSHDHMGDYFYPSLGCDCWKADYDAAKEAMRHE